MQAINEEKVRAAWRHVDQEIIAAPAQLAQLNQEIHQIIDKKGQDGVDFLNQQLLKLPVACLQAMADIIAVDYTAVTLLESNGTLLMATFVIKNIAAHWAVYHEIYVASPEMKFEEEGKEGIGLAGNFIPKWNDSSYQYYDQDKEPDNLTYETFADAGRRHRDKFDLTRVQIHIDVVQVPMFTKITNTNGDSSNFKTDAHRRDKSYDLIHFWALALLTEQFRWADSSRAVKVWRFIFYGDGKHLLPRVEEAANAASVALKYKICVHFSAISICRDNITRRHAEDVDRAVAFMFGEEEPVQHYFAELHDRRRNAANAAALRPGECDGNRHTQGKGRTKQWEHTMQCQDA